MKKKALFFALLVSITGVWMSCQTEEDLLPGNSGLTTTKSSGDYTGWVNWSFTFDIEDLSGSVPGVPFEVAFIDRYNNRYFKVNQSMCPFQYDLYIPVGASVNANDFEIIATNSCIRYIDGFKLDGVVNSHQDTYHFKPLWTWPEYAPVRSVVAMFDKDYPRPAPPQGGPDSFDTPTMWPIHVGIHVQVEPGLKVQAQNYVYKFENLSGDQIISGIDPYYPLIIRIENTTSEYKQVTISKNGQTNKLIEPKDTVEVSLPFGNDPIWEMPKVVIN